MTVAQIREMPPRKSGYAGAGILLTRLDPSGPRYLLLCGRESDIWSFPKGHPEDCDRRAPLRTAVRETCEETGYIAGRDYTIYGSSMRFGKRPYWVGLLHADAPLQPRYLSEREHSCARWFSSDEMTCIKTNSDVRDWCIRHGLHTQFHSIIMTLSASAMQSTHSIAPVYSAS
jgi:8-oxo-dGTP pyrophosphatase MutT (NUDIX family)